MREQFHYAAESYAATYGVNALLQLIVPHLTHANLESIMAQIEGDPEEEEDEWEDVDEEDEE
jgi:hypothetical protein